MNHLTMLVIFTCDIFSTPDQFVLYLLLNNQSALKFCSWFQFLDQTADLYIMTITCSLSHHFTVLFQVNSETACNGRLYIGNNIIFVQYGIYSTFGWKGSSFPLSTLCFILIGWKTNYLLTFQVLKIFHLTLFSSSFT